MIDYKTTVERVPALGLWDVALRDGTTLRVGDGQLDELALALAFRLTPLDGAVQHGPTGVELVYREGARIHLCYSDEAELFAQAVTAAAGACGVTV